MKIIGIIPSRYASTRFPGKPLADIGGKTMIQRVYEQALKATRLSEVLVATDDDRIYQAVASFGGQVVTTSGSCRNGTERCAEAMGHTDVRDEDIIVNIQGDEPFIQPAQIDLLATCFDSPSTQIATLIKEHPLNEDLQHPARVKVVINHISEAMYFSRSIIPFAGGHRAFTIHGFQSPSTASDSTKEIISAGIRFYKHIGIYAYRVAVLKQLVQLVPTPLETAENLEQLRWLENGYRITCAVTPHDSISVDVPEDLEAIKKLL